MKTPLEKASDCVLNRHMAQLAITRHLIESEATTLSKIASLGVDTSSVDAVLLYANEESCDFLELPDWWKLRSNSIIQHLK
jgi:ubiquinone biosynthesis protein COQ9